MRRAIPLMAVAAWLCVAERAEAISGAVFDATNAQPIAGAELFLLDDASGARVARELLGPGQQGQRTGSAGSYQFDPPAGTYRLEVVAPVGYAFPARVRPIGGSEVLPFGAAAQGTAPVSAQAQPTTAPEPYYLRFSAHGARGELVNNHVPLTPLRTLVQLTHSARLPRIQSGESDAFTVRVVNATAQALSDASLELSAPQGFTLHDASGRPLSGALTLPGITVAAGESYELKYTASAGASIRPGRYVFRASFRANGVAVPDASASISVEADPLFERSEILGRVFCDDNGDGSLDRGEGPIARARVYLDNGAYAVTDDHGKYHFSNVAGGYHLAKIDPDSVPPGSRPTRAIRRDFHLSPGLPAKIDFGFHCNLVREDVPIGAIARPSLAISGSLEPLAITLGANTFAAGEVAIALKAPGLLAAHVQTGLPITAYAVVFRDAAENVIHRVEGRGAPPAEIAFGEEGKRAASYELALWSETVFVRSARGSFTGAASSPPITLRGDLFTAAGRPTPELMAKLAELKPRLLASSGALTVEAHSAGDGAPTQKQAESVRSTLASYGVPLGRMQARGRGDEQPLAPNIGKRAREQNRRVTIAFDAAAASLPTARASASVQGVEVALEEGRFASTAHAGEHVAVALQSADGRVLIVQSAPRKVAVEIAGGLLGDQLRVDGVLVPLPLASFSCSASPPLTFSFAGKLSELEDVQVTFFDAQGDALQAFSLPPKATTLVPAALPAGATRYRCSAKDKAGGEVHTASSPVPSAAAPIQETIVRGRLFIENALGSDLKNALEAALSAGAQLESIDVHSGAPPQANPRREQLATLAEAALVKRYLEERGVKNVAVRGLGKSQPLVPPLGKRALEQNRRVVLRASSSQASAEAARAQPRGVVINDTAVAIDERGRFSVTILVDAGEPIRIAQANGLGRDAIYRVHASAEASFRATAPNEAASAPSTTPSTSREASGVAIELPPDGAVIKQDQLVVTAYGAPGGEVLVNGASSHPIGAEGRVTIEIPLILGDNTVIFDVASADGRIGQLVRRYTMQPNRWFLLALGEGSFGQAGAQAMLPETDGESTVQVLNGQYFLHGRAALYFKGRVQGNALFKDNRITAYADTAYAEQGTFVRNVVEPDKFYPVYGDSAAEVQDARQGKLYVLVESDASKLEAGNILTETQGIELFRYDRALFGARLDWNKGFGKYDHTRAKAFVGQPLQSSRRAHATLRGTGGALYFLRDRDIVEGSEQIRFVVRDAVSGTVVDEQVKHRNVDYTIAYDTGRLVFLEPVSAFTQGSLAARLTPISVSSGNPLYIEVDYEARDAGLGNQLAAGGYVKETLFKRVTVGGGFVNERRGDGTQPDYRLYGGSIEVTPIDGVSVTGELNRSEGRDTDLSITTDGGQSFADIDKAQTDVDRSSGAVRPVSGYAMKATAQLDLAKIMKATRDLVTVSAYGARIDPNYYASNATLEQGQVKFGVAAKGTITKKDFVLARHDGVWSDLAVPFRPGFSGFSSRRMNRQLSAVGYEHVERKWDAGALYYHTFSDDSATAPDVHTDTLNLRGSYKLNDRVTLFATQELILQGDPAFVTKTSDRFATELGVRVKLTEKVEAFASEIIRYSGSNATQIGLRSAFGNDGRIYVSERFGRDLGGFTTTTIVGGDNAIARGSRAYGEYQLDAGGFGPQARAVYGLNNRWELFSGLYLGLLYERSQNVGTASGVGTGTASAQGGVPTRTTSFSAQGSGLLSRDRAFFNPSSILGLSFPVGIASRDAASISAEWLRLGFLKITGRLEMRFDNQDIRLGGADRLTWFTTFGVAAQLHRDLSFVGRLEWADAREQAQGRQIAALTQLSLGLAYRPVLHDFVNALLKYTRRGFMRPADLGPGREQETVDAVSFVPIVELPRIRTQIVEKVALKLQELALDDLAATKTLTFLLINRLNFHILRWLDVGAEYRWKRSSADAQGGFLAEVMVSPWEHVRLGAGYNFTHFSDDELADERIDNKGFFIRAVAKY